MNSAIISNDLSHSHVLLDLFLLTLVVILQVHSFRWEILIMSLPASSYFPSNSNGDAPFHSTTFDCSCADILVLRDHKRRFMGDILKFEASAAAAKFCEWI